MRKGIYVDPRGVSPGCSGIEIRDRETQKQKDEKKGLKGIFVEGRGFTSNFEEARSWLQVGEALGRYKLRLFRFGLIV